MGFEGFRSLGLGVSGMISFIQGARLSTTIGFRSLGFSAEEFQAVGAGLGFQGWRFRVSASGGGG